MNNQDLTIFITRIIFLSCGSSVAQQTCSNAPANGPYVLWLAALLVAASVRHDAVGALLVAAVDDVHPGRNVRVSARNGDVLLYVDQVRGTHLGSRKFEFQTTCCTAL